MALPPNGAAYDSMREESLVNGVWYHVLSQVFTFPKYIIAPEYRTGNGKYRGDLFVIRVATDHKAEKAVFAFEGKKGGSDSEFIAGRTQLWDYLDDITKHGTRGYSFGVVAAGTKYAIQQFNGSNMNRRVEPISGILEGGFSPKDYGSIRGAGEYNLILQILQSIEQWIEKNVA